MQQRVPLLLVTGALAFGGIAYFLFLFDDGSMPTKNSPLHPIAHRPKPTGAGANSAAVPSTMRADQHVAARADRDHARAGRHRTAGVNVDRALRKQGGTPGDGSRPEATRAPEIEAGDDDALRCAACEHAITARSEGISVNGAHAHEFKNPSGVDYVVGCFARAPGCAGFGEASNVWTWFPGYAWRVELCGSCRSHLGWSYAAPAMPVASFFALIVDRLAR